MNEGISRNSTHRTHSARLAGDKQYTPTGHCLTNSTAIFFLFQAEIIFLT